jgi:hypothetical protein
MGLAKFTAKDPYNPAATEEELDEIIPKIHGVIDWTVHEDGDVTLEYDRHLISDELIEDALVGMGFKLKHIFDEPDASEAEVRSALDE